MDLSFAFLNTTYKTSTSYIEHNHYEYCVMTLIIEAFPTRQVDPFGPRFFICWRFYVLLC